MTATGLVAGTAVDCFLDEPLARGLNGETAVDRFLHACSDWDLAGEMLQHDLAQARARGRLAAE